MKKHSFENLTRCTLTESMFLFSFDSPQINGNFVLIPTTEFARDNKYTHLDPIKYYLFIIYDQNILKLNWRVDCKNQTCPKIYTHIPAQFCSTSTNISFKYTSSVLLRLVFQNLLFLQISEKSSTLRFVC